MTRVLVALVILAGSVLIALELGTGPQRLPVEPVFNLDPPSSASALRASLESPGVVSNPEPLPLPEAHAWSLSLCPDGMVWVGGRYCPKVNESRVSGGCVTGERTVAVCMDPFEYPNIPGVFPAVMLDYRSATEACEAEKKRLCSESEWTFACRHMRQDAHCNQGRTELVVRTQELAKPERVSEEIAAHEGRRPSGESSCVSDFRVFDLLGNVQEWVKSEHTTEYVGALKGGRYNQGLIGCGRTIYVSDPWVRYPHTGLRCCADPLADVATSP